MPLLIAGETLIFLLFGIGILALVVAFLFLLWSYPVPTRIVSGLLGGLLAASIR